MQEFFYRSNPQYKCSGCGEVIEGDFPSGPIARWFSIYDDAGNPVGITGQDPDSNAHLVLCAACCVDILREMLNTGHSLPRPGKGGWIKRYNPQDEESRRRQHHLDSNDPQAVVRTFIDAVRRHDMDTASRLKAQVSRLRTRELGWDKAYSIMCNILEKYKSNPKGSSPSKNRNPKSKITHDIKIRICQLRSSGFLLREVAKIIQKEYKIKVDLGTISEIYTKNFQPWPTTSRITDDIKLRIIQLCQENLLLAEIAASIKDEYDVELSLSVIRGICQRRKIFNVYDLCRPECAPITQRTSQYFGVPRGGRWVHPPRDN